MPPWLLRSVPPFLVSRVQHIVMYPAHFPKALSADIKSKIKEILEGANLEETSVKKIRSTNTPRLGHLAFSGCATRGSCACVLACSISTTTHVCFTEISSAKTSTKT